MGKVVDLYYKIVGYPKYCSKCHKKLNKYDKNNIDLICHNCASIKRIEEDYENGRIDYRSKIIS